MGLKQSQSMKTTLGTTMTPELQQAVKLLQMSVLELQQEVTKALEENPTLEEVTADDDHGGEGAPQTEAAPQSNEIGGDQNQIADSNDPDFQNFVERGLSATSWKSTRQLNSDEIPSYEQVLTRPATLQDHLNWQLRMSTDEEKVLLIGEEMIGNINEDGYLVILLEEVADLLKVDLAEVEAVLYRIQRFDPPGVAARELKECLLLQAEALKEDDALEQIIENHLPELENKNYASIAKSMNLSMDYVIELCKVIHSMEPKPGRAFVTTEPQFFVPDVYVIKVGGDFVVVLNEDQLPRLRISKPYQTGVSSGEYAGEVKNYVKDKLKGAMWLMKSIYHRQRTIYRATQAILKRQMEFFEKGPQYLRPMVLKDIAEDLTLHESTISRVTNNKYVHTPHGIFELKYFFNSGISAGDGGEDFASESVKQKIREIVVKENPKDPVSDQTIVDMLSEINVKIARRTVAKYREALNILPSNKRKKFF